MVESADDVLLQFWLCVGRMVLQAATSRLDGYYYRFNEPSNRRGLQTALKRSLVTTRSWPSAALRRCSHRPAVEIPVIVN